MLTIFGAIAEFEHELNLQRQREGIKIAIKYKERNSKKVCSQRKHVIIYNYEKKINIFNRQKWNELAPLFVEMRRKFTVYSFYRRSGLWDKILQHLVKVPRKNAVLNENLTFAHKAKIQKFYADGGYSKTFIVMVKIFHIHNA